VLLHGNLRSWETRRAVWGNRLATDAIQTSAGSRQSSLFESRRGPAKAPAEMRRWGRRIRGSSVTVLQVKREKQAALRRRFGGHRPHRRTPFLLTQRVEAFCGAFWPSRTPRSVHWPGGPHFLDGRRLAQAARHVRPRIAEVRSGGCLACGAAGGGQRRGTTGNAAAATGRAQLEAGTWPAVRSAGDRRRRGEGGELDSLRRLAQLSSQPRPGRLEITNALRLAAAGLDGRRGARRLAQARELLLTAALASQLRTARRRNDRVRAARCRQCKWRAGHQEAGLDGLHKEATRQRIRRQGPRLDARQRRSMMWPGRRFDSLAEPPFGRLNRARPVAAVAAMGEPPDERTAAGSAGLRGGRRIWTGNKRRFKRRSMLCRTWRPMRLSGGETGGLRLPVEVVLVGDADNGA